jgi:hypothetical protein
MSPLQVKAVTFRGCGTTGTQGRTQNTRTGIAFLFIGAIGLVIFLGGLSRKRKRFLSAPRVADDI